jgi:hypothetical protein
LPGNSRFVCNDPGEPLPLAHKNRYAGAEARPDYAPDTRSRGKRNILNKLLEKVRNLNLEEIPDKAAGTNGLGVAINLAARQGWIEIVRKHIERDPLSLAHARERGLTRIQEVLLAYGAAYPDVIPAAARAPRATGGLSIRATSVRFATDADPHRVEMSHQQSSLPAHCAGQSYDQISDLAACRRTFMCIVAQDRCRSHTCLEQLLAHQQREARMRLHGGKS